MDDVLDEIVSPEDLKNFEIIYNDQVLLENQDTSAQFKYAWCLVRSKYSGDISKGISLLQDLYNKTDASGRRDCIYYLAIGNARIKEYDKALKYINEFFEIEPGNAQVHHLELLIKKKKSEDSKENIAKYGIVALIVGIFGLVVASKK